MNRATQQSLDAIFRLIEDNRLDEARAALEPLLVTAKDSPDVWWLFAHATQDVESARTALNNVLQRDPNYPDARQLLNDLEAQAPAKNTGGIKKLSTITSEMRAAQPAVQLKTFDDEPDFSLEDEIAASSTVTGEKVRRSRRPLWIALAVLVFALALIAVILLLNRSGTSLAPATATQQVAVPTLPLSPDAQAAAVTTEEGLVFPTESQQDIVQTPIDSGRETPAVSVFSLDLYYAAFSAYQIPPQGIVVRQSDFGETLNVTICSPSSDLAAIRGTLEDAMTLLANQAFVERAALAASTIDALSVEIRNCETDSVLRSVAVGLQDALAFVEGTLTLGEFQARWRAQ